VEDTKICKCCGVSKAATDFYRKSIICKTCQLEVNKINFTKRKTATGFCLECGVQLINKRKEALFCGRECKGKHQFGSTRVSVTCGYCGNLFEKKASWANRSDVHYCSNECYHNYLHENNWTTILCEFCGIEKKLPLYREGARFCSKACDSEWRRTLTGELSPSWKCGLSTENEIARTRADIKKWKILVFTRDNWTCQSCGKRGGDLNAHHIKRFRDYPDLRATLDNGVTLCVPCHKVETKAQASTPKSIIKE
jgi:hypothetical protein